MSKPSQPPKPVPRVTARAIVLHQDHVLLLRAVEEGREYYFLPGGRVSHGESLVDAARRETQEECGVAIEVLRPLYVREFIASRHKRRPRAMPEKVHVVATLFLAHPDPEVHGEAAAAEIGSFPGMIDNAETVKGYTWVPLDALRSDENESYEIMPPHVKRALQGEFPPPESAGIEFWLED